MTPEEFYKELKAFSWDNGGDAALNFLRQHKDCLSYRDAADATLIQVLMGFNHEQEEVDKVISRILEVMSDEMINTQGEDLETPLMTAVRTERYSVVERLLQKKADVTIRNFKKRTPLHSASYNGDVKMMKLLLDVDESLTTARDHQWLTPLDIACWKGHPEAVKLLISRDHGAIDMVDDVGKSPLFTASEYGGLESVQAILEASTDTINKADEDGVTPLDRVASKGFEDLAKLLIEKGADIECRDNKGYTPLLTASVCGHLPIVELLLDANADATVKNNDGKTCLIRAGRFGFTEVVRRLLEVDAVRETINTTDNQGATALDISCTYGRTDVVALLLDAGANRLIADENGWTPILTSTKWRYPDIVELLLQRNIEASGTNAKELLSQRREQSEGFTALHYACYFGHLRMAKLLLWHGADVNETDGEGRTVLHNASRQGYKEIATLVSKELKDVSAVDNSGWTALHYASWSKVDESDFLKDEDVGHEPYTATSVPEPVPGKHVEILEHLLREGIDPFMTTNDGETALHLASANGHHSRISILLESMKSKRQATDFTMKDANDKTALCRAVEEQNAQVVRQLLQRMHYADFGNVEDKEELMLWLAKRQETHDLIRLLLSKEISAIERPPTRGSSGEWSALEWAAFRGYPKLVWWLLFSSSPGPERDRRIRAAERIAKEIVTSRRDNTNVSGTKGGSGGKESQQDGSESKQSTSAIEADDHLQVLEILHNPPMTQTAGQRQQLKQLSDKPLYSPHSLDLITHYTAEVVDCYGFKDHSGFLRRYATVKDVIYVRGPAQIMTEARERTHKLDSRFGPEDGTAGNTWTEDDVNVRWIHLPANNMKWMNDLALTVSGDADIDGSGLAWLERSYDQVLGKNTTSRFMKPKCLYRMETSTEDDDSDDSDDDVAQMAIYMPYLTLAIHKKNPAHFEPEYQQLLEDYSDTVIHGSRTLDEFYYHSCEDENLRRDILTRNEDQVLSKTIHGYVSNLSSWVLLNVDQVWIWVVDEKTIITSSTHRRDDVEDPLLTAVLENLSHANESSSGNRGPTDTMQMSRLIIDTCVGFFDREFQMKVDSRYPNWKGSVQDVFTNAMAQAALKEAVLYDQFATNERSRRAENTRNPQATQKRRDILDAAGLFREIKDIRDELKMLKTIAEFQRTVQEDAPELPSPLTRALSSKAIVDGLREMDKAAERIETAVNTTLTLEQNEISIAQAQEAVSQGRTLMLFTVVTILFLPLSFFTSLFALDVASFQKTPVWAFVVLFSISFTIFTPLATYASDPVAVTGWYYKLRDHLRNMRRQPQHAEIKDMADVRELQRRGTGWTDASRPPRYSMTSINAEANERFRNGFRARGRHYDEESWSNEKPVD